MDFSKSVLSSLLWCPIVGALIVSLLPRRVAKEGALVVALCNFVFSLHLLSHWNQAPNVVNQFRFVENAPWLPQIGVNYHLGVDGISLWLVLLTTFLTPLVMLFSWNLAQRTKEFMVCLLLMEAAIIGVFCALDVILFYIFWEAVLIPTLLLIGTWGGAKRAYAGVKFFVYTMAGSVLMWVAMLYLYLQQPASTRSFGYDAMLRAANALDTNSTVAFLLFGAFAIAFAIKAPLFPFHTWLPDAYAEAPTAASVMLAGVLSKMGIYGFLRFAIPFFPATAREFAPVLGFLAIVGIIYGALVAIHQTDVKKVIAYSSVSHLGLILLGVFASLGAVESGTLALSGATLQMVAHGLSTGALFLLVGAMLGRVPNREMGAFGGVAAIMPRFTVLFWIALFASIGLPGLSNFVGEYLIFQGVMAANFWWAVLATTTVILSAIYMLRMFRNTMYGEVTHPENSALPDLNRHELVVLAVLSLAILYVGLKPQPLLSTIEPDAREIIAPRPDSEQSPVAQLPQTSSTR